MNIKVGWHRYGNKFVHSSQTHKIYEMSKYHKDLLITVADTPQELIQLYDIVELRNGYTFKVEEIKNNKVYDRLGDRGFDLQDITSIHTPNANGGYDLQYSEEKE